ncbi:FG-GAP and VCBS repeat-containing protein [Nannocystis punicea]|uniref:FG-GAP and VCBS repeat-containing protein n=1 Tax=Nannocystis punicea TaxID=2995304 RepID=A0ABY7GTN8_9BACT|nr:FG-GAP and VCBS repeat-containing protein [Nannocystis poenicansa]WAS90295.1 FG-GAP and VCBS repeat-containing protein [Nannocystis poenicansa]
MTSSTGDPSPTEPTSETSATSETSDTSGPPPECRSDSDCDGFCEYCVEGECYDAVGCCGVVAGPQGELELRCQGYGCEYYDDCSDGEVCEEPGGCVLIEAIPLCERLPLTLSELPLQGQAEALALVDLDGDAARDLVVVLPDAGQVEVLLGDGLGGFAPGEVFPTGMFEGTQRLAVADFDGDGSQDLAVSQVPLAELSLLFGQDGVFAAPVADSAGNGPLQLWSGDFDGDGAPDLLSRGDDPDMRIALRLGDGMGGLGEPFGAVNLGTAKFTAAVGLAAGDPAELDLLLTDWNGPQVNVFEFAAGVGLEQVEALQAPGLVALDSLVAGDVDGDGQVDLIGHRETQGHELLTIWSLKQPRPDLRVEGAVVLGTVGDVDGDGAGDLVTGAPAAMRVIFVAGGEGPCVQSHPLADDPTPELLAAGDVDGDGRADVIAAAPGQASVALLRSGP